MLLGWQGGVELIKFSGGHGLRYPPGAEVLRQHVRAVGVYPDLAPFAPAALVAAIRLRARHHLAEAFE